MSLFRFNSSGNSVIKFCKLEIPPSLDTLFAFSIRDCGKSVPSVSSMAAGKFKDARILKKIKNYFNKKIKKSY